MKNQDVIDLFVSGYHLFASKKIKNSTGSLYVTDGKLINYKTCLAQWKDGVLYINEDKYSPTTSRIQAGIRRHASSRYNNLDWKVKYVSGYPRESIQLVS